MSDTVYQLRRVGLPATVTEVKDVMRLTSEVTRFGRHSGNDFFLDSTETLLLVSRWHAEIHRTVSDGGVQHIVRDSSLNGTYVNDVRVKGNHVLKEGDTITFGHKMGRDIEPGQYAPQPTSEFRFIFEKATDGDDDGRLLGAGDGTVVLKDVSNNSKRRTNEGLLPLDCLIDAGTAILSSSGRVGVPLAGQQVKRILAVPPKTVGSMLGGASGNLTVAAVTAAGRPKMPPSTGMAQRLPTPLASNKGRASLQPAGGQPTRKRAPKHHYSDEEDFDDLDYDDDGGSSSKRGKKPKKAMGGGRQLVDDWSYHQEQQRCDFYDCRTPRGDTVSWVQCDDCDKWYHTVCVGCSYEVVRNDNAEFHCGCI